MKKVYCEPGALTDSIRKLAESGCVELVHFPYDPNSYVRLTIAMPSKAKIDDLNLPTKDLPATIADYSPSVHLKEILLIINGSNRRDALHIDSTLKSGCQAFVTADCGDILSHREELEANLGIKFFHPNEWRDLKLFCGEP